MAQTSLILMGNTGGEVDVIGEPVRGDGWFGEKDGLHTISIQTANFSGRFWLEATLANTPTEDDWFPVYLTICAPQLDFESDTGIHAYTFYGNFVFVRARVDRSQVVPEPVTVEQIQALGAINRVLMNH